mmetsp:Transcript_88680/g.255725  ORF Transcript_88680/g.255725 Transcript_88680/m.255725 type:complete len:244 (-) Transcript_88680:106-837(-)
MGGTHCCRTSAVVDDAEFVKLDGGDEPNGDGEQHADGQVAPDTSQTNLSCAEHVGGTNNRSGDVAEFNAHVVCVSEHAGFHVDVADGVSVFVMKLEENTAKAWKIANPHGPTLLANDRIVRANGVGGDSSKLIHELQSSRSWDLGVQRPKEVSVTIDRKGGPLLGLDLQYAPNGTTLVVSGVGEGPVREWNEQQPPNGVRIEKFDRIAEINGARGCAKMLMAAAAERDRSLHMTILKFGGSAA